MSTINFKHKPKLSCIDKKAIYNKRMKTITALIVAAGRGTRTASDIPKQYHKIAGKPILYFTIKACLKHNDISQIVCIIHKDDVDLYKETISEIKDTRLSPPAFGGDTRSQSVLNGLNEISSEFVLIHDGARPFLPKDALSRVIEGVQKHDACFLGLPIVDAIWAISDNITLEPVAREKLWRAQTPQAFVTKTIRNAHLINNNSAIDDVEIARNAGIKVTPILGAEENIKITWPTDFSFARRLIGENMDVRVGNGYDVHAFGMGDFVILNGIKIIHSQALIGHSDADVAMHAITDAIFGALCEGDIGQWFPPSDYKWKGAPSDIFLRKAVSRCHECGLKINHLDCTIICELPKIAPYTKSMQENLSQITGITINRISIKATTSEQLGFTGRNEGIAAQATATLISL